MALATWTRKTRHPEKKTSTSANEGENGAGLPSSQLPEQEPDGGATLEQCPVALSQRRAAACFCCRAVSILCADDTASTSVVRMDAQRKNDFCLCQINPMVSPIVVKYLYSQLMVNVMFNSLPF